MRQNWGRMSKGGGLGAPWLDPQAGTPGNWWLVVVFGLKLSFRLASSSGAQAPRGLKSAPRQFADQVAYEGFGVAEEHQGFVQVIELVVDAREAGAQAALDHHYGLGLVDIQNRHAVDGAGGIGARGGIGDVVGADDERHVRLRELG